MGGGGQHHGGAGGGASPGERVFPLPGACFHPVVVSGEAALQQGAANLLVGAEEDEAAGADEGHPGYAARKQAAGGKRSNRLTFIVVINSHTSQDVLIVLFIYWRVFVILFTKIKKTR